MLFKLSSKLVFITCIFAVYGTLSIVYAQANPVKAENTKKVKFSFPANANIEDVINTVAAFSNKIVIIDPRVKGVINFTSEKPVSPNQAFAMLGSILRMNGYAMVEENGYIRVVPEAEVKQIGSKVLSNKKAPNNGQVFTQIFQLKYESATAAAAMIRNLVSSNNASTVVASTQAGSSSNSLIVTDYAENLHRIAKVIETIDVPRQTNSNVEMINLQHAMASDVAAILAKVFDNSSDINLRVNLTIDGRTNTIILHSVNSAKLRQLKELALRLDTPTTQQGNIWVVQLKNADANNIAQTLRAVLSADNNLSNTSNSASALSNLSNSTSTTSLNNTSNLNLKNSTNTSFSNNSNNNTNSNNNFTTENSSLNSLNNSNSLGGQVQADIATNSVIITASEVQYKNLRAIIDKLDVQRAQVFVESMIVEISDQKVAELGVQWQALLGGGANRFYVGSGIAGSGNIAQVGSAANSILNLGNGASGTDLAALSGAATGFNLAWLHQFGKTFGLSALAKALSQQTGVNILSTPNLLTLDNEEAKIIIGQNVPFITGQYTNGNNNGSTVNPFQTIERNDVGITLKVKPQVTSNDKVKLKIYQETSSVDDKSNTSGIITNKRSIDTTVEVKNGEAIVLGGLLEDNYNDGIEKVPGLSSLPLIGGLFRYERKSRGKKNLMLFLRPYVVFDNANELTTSRYDYIKQQQMNYVPNTKILKEETYPILNLDNKNILGMSYELKQTK